MNPASPPSKDERFDSLEKSHGRLKEGYTNLLREKESILTDLIQVKSKLVTTLANDSKNQNLIKRLKKRQYSIGTICTVFDIATFILSIRKSENNVKR